MFASRYMAPRYWCKVGATPPAPTGVIQMITLQQIGNPYA